MDTDERGSTASFGRTPSSEATGSSTNVAMVGLAGSEGQTSSVGQSPGASSGSALNVNVAPQRAAIQTSIEEALEPDDAMNGPQGASDFPVQGSILDVGSTGVEAGRSVALSNQFEALGNKQSRSRSPSVGPQTTKKTSGCGTPGQTVGGRISGRSTPKSGVRSSYGKIGGADARLDQLLLIASPGSRSNRSDFPEGPSIQDETLRPQLPDFMQDFMTPNQGLTPGSHSGPGGASPPGIMSPRFVSNPISRGEASSPRPVRDEHVSMMINPGNGGNPTPREPAMTV